MADEPMWKRLDRARAQGAFNQPGLPPSQMDAVQRSAYEQGKRLRGERTEPLEIRGAPRQTLGEAVETAFWLAGAAGGVLLGLARVGSGEGSWIGVAVLFIVGGVAGLLLQQLLSAGIRRIRHAILWRRGREERTASMLTTMWGELFGETILPQLLRQVDEQGKAWTMDRRGTLLLRTREGRVISIRRTGDGSGATVDISGRKQSEMHAYLIALVHRSMGQRRIRMPDGSRKHRRTMWAAARMAGLELEDFTPDPKAIRILESMRRDPRIAEVEEPEEA